MSILFKPKPFKIVNEKVYKRMFCSLFALIILDVDFFFSQIQVLLVGPFLGIW